MALKVNLWGQLLGALDYTTSTGVSYFQFNPACPAALRNAAPILMPPTRDASKVYGPFHVRSHPAYDGLPPMLADSLPDSFGNDMLRTYLKLRNKPHEMTVEQRLCYVGNRGMGALEYWPRLLGDVHSPDNLELTRLAALSHAISGSELPAQQITRGLLNHLFLVGTSAGGARPKALVSIHSETNQLTITEAHKPGFVPVVLKFDQPNTQHASQPLSLGKIEYIYHRMATNCGIRMSQCGLLKQEPLQHFVTARFDRTKTGEKLHMQTLAAIAGMPPNQLHDYDDVFGTLLKLGLPYRDLEELFTRMVFNLLSANDDCHTKNTAFLMDEQGQWSLAPAYDLTFPYEVRRVWKRPHPISINGKTTNIQLNDVLEVAKRFGVKRPKTTIARVQDALAEWPKLADRYRLDRASASTIPTYFQRLLS